jgi:hypothetical protein
LKEVEWSGQRSEHGVKGAMVNTGTFILHFLLLHWPDNTPEKYFSRRHPQNKTLFAIHVTTLAIYVLYHVPCHGAAILLAGMRSILKSEISLGSLASKILMDPRRLLTMYDLDPITRMYICCPSCYALYPHEVLTSKKWKAPASFNGSSHASGDNIGDIQLGAPTYCMHCWVCKGKACGKALFNKVIINGKNFVIPWCKYEAQDLKQWIRWLISCPLVKEEISKAF